MKSCDVYQYMGRIFEAQLQALHQRCCTLPLVALVDIPLQQVMDVVLRHLWRWLCYTHLCVVVTDVVSLSIIARVTVVVISLCYREG
jgi:hypothetical protein